MHEEAPQVTDPPRDGGRGVGLASDSGPHSGGPSWKTAGFERRRKQPECRPPGANSTSVCLHLCLGLVCLRVNLEK